MDGWGSARVDGLIVEPDVHAGAMLRFHLQALGFQVFHATTAQEALDYLAEGQPSLVVVELALPDAHGQIILDALRASARHRSCRVLVTSPDGSVSDHEGADGLLVKPFDGRKVRTAIESVGIRTGR